MFCLDTNIIIGVMTKRRPFAMQRLQAELDRRTRLLIPAVVLYELRYGADKSALPERNHARLDDFLTAEFEVMPFDEADAAQASLIRAHLEKRGAPIGPYDILIAAQARVRNAVLVTSNRRGFGRVPGLMVTDWDAGWATAQLKASAQV